MKNFFKMLLATVIGSLIASVIGFFLILTIIGSMAGSFGNKIVNIKPNSILEISFKNTIPERTPSDFFSAFNEDEDKALIGLDDIIFNIQKAATDKDIKGIYLNFSWLSAGQATLLEIRNELLEFKKTGKFVVAYGEMLSDDAYMLASTADKVFLNPSGAVLFNGFAGHVTMYKGLLDKLGIEFQVFRVGKYKSAVEPFIQDAISDENRSQIQFLVNNLFNQYLKNIAENRKLTVGYLRNVADSFSVRTANDAVKFKLVDQLAYEDEVKTYIETKLSTTTKEKSHMVNLSMYRYAPWKGKKASKNKVAVIFAVGEIGQGEGDDQSVGSEGLRKAIEAARLDKDIKAIVLRINSPGGSSIASDVIAREVKLAAKEKLLVVSMGDLAASGGYYIASFADAIIAQPNTITGSIGVFGLYPNMNKLLVEKLGMRFETIKTTKYSDFGSIDRPLNEDEKSIVQASVNQIYDDFLGVVEKGRKLDSTYVNSIAQGRVWPADTALKLKLVDQIGGLSFAINYAVKQAGLADYKIVRTPEISDPLKKLFGSKKSKEEEMMKTWLGEHYSVFEWFKTAAEAKPQMMMRMPYNISFSETSIR